MLYFLLYWCGGFPLRLFFLCLLFTCGVAAASFDCRQAQNSIEKTICSDPALSSLDDRLSASYKHSLGTAGEGEVGVRADQRKWLADLKEKCSDSDVAACVRNAYNERLKQLDSRKPFDPASVTEYRLTNASHYFDFVVRIQARNVTAGDDKREGPGHILIYAKGASKPFQIIGMDNIFASLDKANKPLVNTAPLYDYQGLINVGDFNFDGHEDFAIQNGNDGAYQGPSYDVFLYAPGENIFRFSKSMTLLIQSTLGFFQVDSGRRLLSTFAKEGCCYHETVEYQIIKNQPVPVSRIVEDATQSEKYVVINHQKMVNGKWQGPGRRVPQAEYERSK